MANKRLPSPTNEEIERMAESIDSLDSFNEIQDFDSFEVAYEDYFEGNLGLRDNDNVKREVFEEIRILHPGRISDERLFKKAKGKDLKKDRRRTAKRVTTSKQQYIEKGASKIDLKGYDTKRKTRDLSVVGRVKGKVVFSSKELVTVKGKRVTRHRDKLGRFVSVNK